MTNDYVTLPREPTREMLAAFFAAIKPSGVHTPGWLERGYAAMIAAAPPAASVRAKDVTNLEIATAFHEAYERLAPRYGYETRPESRKPFSDLPNELKLLMVAVVREVRTLLAPAVDERAASSEPEMCPNCVTPWKCNGPHEFPQAASSEAAVAFDAERFERAPCYLCGYNGRGYYQPETHPCAAKYHAHPAPTTADAGVTEAIALIAAERRRQVEAEGWTPAHDDEHDCGQLAKAAACYALGEWWRTHRKSMLAPDFWPWDNGWWKPTPKDRVRELIKAGALIAAEIDRLKRTEGKGNG